MWSSRMGGATAFKGMLLELGLNTFGIISEFEWNISYPRRVVYIILFGQNIVSLLW
jgi:hypothetical protein